ncbi:hypothetical protein HIM_06925 [Hirsutella minnesotensis 3608]|uniref:Prenylated Rab acceptor 1 n=1 Tax=Hirsutella minnesotensis 3608 TaxID=1043627 RepID=A0A0F7ZZ47_9HYPO|nr:hypothetical protein HIM_06925 [Hirsutella minnesotensis 3608]
MSRIQIPLDVLTSRLNLGDRFQGLRAGPLSGRFSNLRPVSEFCDFKRLSKPANFGEMQSRVNYNLSHFSSNYAVVFAMLSIYALLTNWLLLFDIILVVAGMFLIGKLQGRDLEIGNFRATSSQLYTGLLIVAVPLGLIASPFSTLLWLIGASGVAILGGLGGRPRAPKFAPPWGRPSRRGRRRTEGDSASQGFWGSDSRIEEVDTDGGDGADARAVGRRNGRFVSDSLEFTGIDLGDRSGDLTRRERYGGLDETEDDGSTTCSDDDETDSGDELAGEENEEALVRSALQRIERARAKGKVDVKLNKQELAALERRRKRIEEEERRVRSAGGRSRKKPRAARIAVPLTHLEPVSRKRAPAVSDPMPRHVSAGEVLDSPVRQQGQPQMGYFRSPSASTTRLPSGTTSSRVSSHTHDARGQLPILRVPVPSSRHVSDSATRSYSRGSASGVGSLSRTQLDPFQYQTAGPRAVPAGNPAIAKRYVSGPSEVLYETRAESVARQSLDEETSEADSGTGSGSGTSDGSSSDDRGHGVQISEPHSRGRGMGIVVEVSPARDSARKKKSSPSSSSKKKTSESKRKKR